MFSVGQILRVNLQSSTVIPYHFRMEGADVCGQGVHSCLLMAVGSSNRH